MKWEPGERNLSQQYPGGLQFWRNAPADAADQPKPEYPGEAFGVRLYLWPGRQKDKSGFAGWAIDYEYDALGQLTGERKASGNNQYQQALNMTCGNRSRLVKGNLEHIYTYNNANQLTQENISGPSVMPITVTGTVLTVPE